MTNHKEKIHIIATGGTIDGKYDAPSEKKITKDKSTINKYITETIEPHFSIEFEELMMIDSAYMTNKHRKKITETVDKSTTNKIIITHGTGTMIETAQFLEQHLMTKNKTIILVGAMIPLEGFYPTDAPFNLGYAIAQVQLNEAGIYLCMNAHCFAPHEAIKNLEAARFEFKDAS